MVLSSAPRVERQQRRARRRPPRAPEQRPQRRIHARWRRARQRCAGQYHPSLGPPRQVEEGRDSVYGVCGAQGLRAVGRYITRRAVDRVWVEGPRGALLGPVGDGAVYAARAQKLGDLDESAPGGEPPRYWQWRQAGSNMEL